MNDAYIPKLTPSEERVIELEGINEELRIELGNQSKELQELNREIADLEQALENLRQDIAQAVGARLF